MKHPFKLVTLILFVIITIAVTYISCNKDNNVTSTTRVKCYSCVNGGSCINDTCRCPAGYEGATCETLSVQKFIGEWRVTETGTQTSFAQYVIFIEEQQSGVAGITFQDFYDLYPPYVSYTLSGNINGDSIFMPQQAIDSGYIVGKGYIHSNNITGVNGTISFKYQVVNTYTGIVNDFGYASPVDSPSVWVRD